MGIISGFGSNPGIDRIVELTQQNQLCPAINVTVPTGSTVTCTKGTTSVNASSVTPGTTTDLHVFNPTESGTWTITSTLNGSTSTSTVNVAAKVEYAVTVS